MDDSQVQHCNIATSPIKHLVKKLPSSYYKDFYNKRNLPIFAKNPHFSAQKTPPLAIPNKISYLCPINHTLHVLYRKNKDHGIF